MTSTVREVVQCKQAQQVPISHLGECDQASIMAKQWWDLRDGCAAGILFPQRCIGRDLWK